MKSMKKHLAILCALLLVLTLGLAGCDNKPASSGGSSAGSGSEGSVTKDIAATYLIDATPLGMPLQVYLTIKEDGTFQLSNKLEGGDDKGSGKVGKSGDTYMLLYSDSTTESPKTSTFTVKGKQLVFSTKLFYGSSGFAPDTTDEQNPIYPTAKAMAYGDYLGEYVGTVETQAMNSTLTYSITLTLSYGAEYTLESVFTVMGEEQVYTQTGTFAIDGGKITVTPKDGEATEGTISSDKTIAIQSLVSAQGKEKKDLTLKPATTPDQAGTYTGIKTLNMGAMSMVADATLKLDKQGGYTYVAKMEGEEDYTEKGTFTVDGAKLTFKSDAEGAEAVEGKLENDVLTCKFKISNDVPMATEIAFYSDRIQGTFTAETTDGDTAGYKSELTLNADGTYAITVTKDGAETYAEKGTFEAAGSPMGVTLTLTNEKGGTVSGVVSAESINVNHAVDAAATEAGFQYKK
jgi:uncharacterized lipoprotein NlpE involved in copper resistance